MERKCCGKEREIAGGMGRERRSRKGLIVFYWLGMDKVEIEMGADKPHHVMIMSKQRTKTSPTLHVQSHSC